MEAMTQEQRQKTKEALSRYGQKNWVYGPCNWGWKRAIQSWPRSITARQTRACGAASCSCATWKGGGGKR